MKHINENLKKFRLQKEMTQQEVADELFVTRQCISRWEQGRSIPDIESLEKLTNLYDVTISDILDDESIKTLTITEAVKNRKNKKYLYSSILISAFAVLLTVFGFIILNEQGKEQDAIIEPDQTDTLYAIITEIDIEGYKFTIEHDDQNYEFDVHSLTVHVYDNQSQIISLGDLKVGDTIEITYQKELKEENIEKITVIDSSVDISLLGVVFITNGERYETIDDIPSGEQGIQYYLFDMPNGGRSWKTNTHHTDEFISDGNYLHNSIEINIYFDHVKIQQDAVIGLVYRDSIEYVETLDTSIDSTRTYTGEVDYEPLNPYRVHSVDVTYQLNFHRVVSFNTIDVYEYDMNHNLINTTTIENWEDNFYFTAHEDAIYSYVKVTSEISNSVRTYTTSEVYKLLLGEELDINLSDEYGIVGRNTFEYKFNPLV